jgi:hypothetical protein
MSSLFSHHHQCERCSPTAGEKSEALGGTVFWLNSLSMTELVASGSNPSLGNFAVCVLSQPAWAPCHIPSTPAPKLWSSPNATLPTAWAAALEHKSLPFGISGWSRAGRWDLTLLNIGPVSCQDPQLTHLALHSAAKGRS